MSDFVTSNYLNLSACLHLSKPQLSRLQTKDDGTHLTGFLEERNEVRYVKPGAYTKLSNKCRC